MVLSEVRCGPVLQPIDKVTLPLRHNGYSRRPTFLSSHMGVTAHLALRRYEGDYYYGVR